jgi:hypothetical protein
MSDLNFDGLTDAQLRMFAVRCARRVQHLMTDPRSLKALDVAERHAMGDATDEELSAARPSRRRTPASVAAASAAEAPGAWAAWSAARAAAAAGEATAARDAAGAARDAATAARAAWAAARAAWVVEHAEQQKILEEIRRNKP